MSYFFSINKPLNPPSAKPPKKENRTSAHQITLHNAEQTAGRNPNEHGENGQCDTHSEPITSRSPRKCEKGKPRNSQRNAPRDIVPRWTPPNHRQQRQHHQNSKHRWNMRRESLRLLIFLASVHGARG